MPADTPPTDESVTADSTTPETSASGNSTANLNDIASDLASTMPEVQSHAVEQAAAAARAQESAPTDRAGVRFDPSQHDSGPDGKGLMTARGTWRLKRGRKPGTPASNRAAPPTGSTMGVTGNPAQEQAKAAQVAQCRIAGASAAEMLFMAGRVIGGDEWLPLKDEKIGLDERGMMQQAFGDYFVATNKKDIPPGAALTFALCAYMGPRFAMPQTRARVSTIKQKLVQWWINRKLRKQGLTAEVKTKAPGDTQK